MPLDFNSDNIPSIGNYQFDFEGGRHLNAITKNRKLKIYEKAVLHCLASHQDYRGDFMQWRFMAIEDMADEIGCAARTILRAIQSLEEKGYLLREARWKGNQKLPNNYKLTSKIFQEYAEQKAAAESEPNQSPIGSEKFSPSIGSANQSLPPVCLSVGSDTQSLPSCHKVTGVPPLIPPIDPPFFNSSVSGETEKKQKLESGKGLKTEPTQPGSNVLDFKRASHRRGIQAQAVRMLMLRYKGSNFIGMAIRRAAEHVLRDYSIEVLETIERRDLHHGASGHLTFDLQRLLLECDEVDQWLEQKKLKAE